MNKWRALLLAFALAAAGESAAQVTCTVIASLPHTITASGAYCAESDLDAAGGGLTIAADDVLIDLGGHTIRGPGVNNAVGYCVLAFGRSRITLRNGEIRGCGYGVYLSDLADSIQATGGSFSGGYHHVERLRLSQCTFRGIRIEGNGNLVRNVDLRFIGGDAFYPNSSAIGIESLGPGAKIIGNTVHEVRGGGSADQGLGIGISLSRMSAGSIVQDNRISNSSIERVVPYTNWPAPSRNTLGIWVGDNTQGAVVEGNGVSNFRTGISVNPVSRALVARNTVTGATVISYRMPLVDGATPGFGAGNVCDQPTCLLSVSPTP
jgi:nitrous oxidase accessory protein NosD